MTIRVGSARKRRGHVFRLEQLEQRDSSSTATVWSNYAENAQHTAESTVAGQSLDVIHWETPVDSAPQFSGNDLLVHYGSPLVTAANTVIVPETDEATGGYDVKAFDGATGALMWTQTEGEEFVPPPHDWTPSYSPAVAPLAGRTAALLSRRGWHPVLSRLARRHRRRDSRTNRVLWRVQLCCQSLRVLRRSDQQPT